MEYNGSTDKYLLLNSGCRQHITADGQAWRMGTLLVTCTERKILYQRESREVVNQYVTLMGGWGGICVYIGDIYLC